MSTYRWVPVLLPLAIRLGEGLSELQGEFGSDLLDLWRVLRVLQVTNAAEVLGATILDERWSDRGAARALQTQVLDMVDQGLRAGYTEMIK